MALFHKVCRISEGAESGSVAGDHHDTGPFCQRAAGADQCAGEFQLLVGVHYSTTRIKTLTRQATAIDGTRLSIKTTQPRSPIYLSRDSQFVDILKVP